MNYYYSGDWIVWTQHHLSDEETESSAFSISPESKRPTSALSFEIIFQDKTLQLCLLPSLRLPTCFSTQHSLWVTDQTTHLHPCTNSQWGCKAGTSLQRQPLVSHYSNPHWQSCDSHIVQLRQSSVSPVWTLLLLLLLHGEPQGQNLRWRNAARLDLRDKNTDIIASFALGLYLLWLKVRSELYLMYPCVFMAAERACFLRAICCSRLDENMFTLRAETRVYSCVMQRGVDWQKNTAHGQT